MSLIRTTLLLLVLTLVSRALGLVREIVIAWRFGASAETDAFFVAFTIPYTFYAVVGGALTAVVVPLLAEYEARGQHQEAMRAASMVINVVLLSTVALALGGIFSAPQIAWALGGGFDAATGELSAQFTAMMMPSIILMSVSGVISGILNSRQAFAAPAVGPIAMNATIIMSAIIGGVWGGIQGLVVGTVIGALVFMAVQLPALHSVGYRHLWQLNIKDPVVIRIAGLIWPVMLVSGLSFAYTLIDFRLASSLAEGSVTALNYATKFIQLPQAMFVMAVTTAIFPALSKLATNARLDEMADLLRKGLRAILILAVPGTVGLIVIGEPLIELLFQRGAFSAQATSMTSSALLYLTIGLIGFCVNMPLIRGFYALQDRRTPLLVGVIAVVVKLLLSLGLMRSMQLSGLALATSIAFVINAILLAYLLQRRLPHLFERTFFSFLLKIVVAAGVMGMGVIALDKFLASYLSSGEVLLSARILLDISAGALLFAGVAVLYGVSEIQNATEKAKTLLWPRTVL